MKEGIEHKESGINGQGKRELAKQIADKVKISAKKTVCSVIGKKRREHKIKMERKTEKN